ncbi:septal ring lytic transglycosylase RlpA family protein [Mariprofundus sp. EBB-1]|uniref:septal ring lytic transglycosylase RlpA family protein n=1 Tax=Mariprofundus sp. EBB-1 TaxID=2650971 RepID=UPI001F39E392|nr:septal ring lytic transglycosylase RlpA family protein [Mariprofundus sp. EBB-1]
MIASCSGHVSPIKDSAPDTVPNGQAHLPDGAGGVSKTGKPYRVAGQWYTPLKSEGRYDETGTASWYGTKFHGLLTANGETYDMHALSAAHKTLPLPTLMRVTNLDNGRSVIVRVNDRGPFVKDRLIDLSYAAANALGYTKQGTAHVRVQSLEIPPSKATKTLAMGAKLKAADRSNTITVSSPDTLSLPATAPSGKIFVQLGAFGSQENAGRLQAKLKTAFPAAHIIAVHIAEKTLYRVRIGPFEDMVNIEKTVLSLQQKGFDKPMVIIE